MTPSVQAISDLVMRGFVLKDVAPRIIQVASEILLFSGLNDEQLTRLASTFSVTTFREKERVFAEKEEPVNMYILLDGMVSIRMGNPTATIGYVKKGEIFGELSLLSSKNHSATAVAETRVEAGALNHLDLSELTRQRPDIGLIIYRNLAIGLGEKLLRSDISLRDQLLNKTLDKSKLKKKFKTTTKLS
ncbi:MAG TPA: cyclic nucleotide-binding domain-containing protein [Nitrospiria bacterium]|jgi:CRP-like cAMP-binding protein